MPTTKKVRTWMPKNHKMQRRGEKRCAARASETAGAAAGPPHESTPTKAEKQAAHAQETNRERPRRLSEAKRGATNFERNAKEKHLECRKRGRRKAKQQHGDEEKRGARDVAATKVQVTRALLKRKDNANRGRRGCQGPQGGKADRAKTIKHKKPEESPTQLRRPPRGGKTHSHRAGARPAKDTSNSRAAGPTVRAGSTLQQAARANRVKAPSRQAAPLQPRHHRNHAPRQRSENRRGPARQSEANPGAHSRQQRPMEHRQATPRRGQPGRKPPANAPPRRGERPEPAPNRAASVQRNTGTQRQPTAIATERARPAVATTKRELQELARPPPPG